MKKLLILLSFLLLTACQTVSNPTDSVPDTTLNKASLANPASVYCGEQGGKLEIRENKLGQYGVCIFPDESECEEWKYFRGECNPGENKLPDTSSINGFDDCVNAGNSIMESHPRQCKTADGRSFTEVLDKPIEPPTTDVPQICTMDYTPVCALIQAQCIKAPCSPLFQTKSNECTAKSLGNMLLGFTPGECEKDLRTKCKTNADCTLPGDYASMSRCPFEAKCVVDSCVVVCPQGHASGDSTI